MKKRVLILMMAVAPVMAFAQVNTRVEKETGSWKGFETNKFWDNWFIQIGAGAQMYSGQFDDKEDFGKRLTPVFDLGVGKWFTPTVGSRIQASGFNLKSLTDDPGNLYTKGKEPRVEGMYKQDWQQFNVHVDGLLNLSNWIGGYRSDRFYEFIPYVGFGVVHACQSGGRTDLMGTLGLINKMRISNTIDFNVEMRANAVPGEFDGDTGGAWFKGMLAVSGGLTFNLGKTTFDKSETRMVSTGISQSEFDAVRDALALELARAERLQADLDRERNRPTQVEVVKEVQAAPLAIFFQLDKSNITPQELVNLEKYAAIIKNNPNKVYKVTGYADKATGKPAYNQRLSERRARNVADALTKKFGVSSSQLQVSGQGGVTGLYGNNIQLNRVVIIE